MGLVIIVLLIVIASSGVGISGTLRKMHEHTAKFLPPDEQGCRVKDGDTIIVVAKTGLGHEYRVASAYEHPDGTVAVTVETL